jgi:hypothetical protein
MSAGLAALAALAAGNVRCSSRRPDVFRRTGTNSADKYGKADEAGALRPI